MPFSPTVSLCSSLRGALLLTHSYTHCNLQENVASSLLCLFLLIYPLLTSQAPSTLVVQRQTTLDTDGYFNSLKQLNDKREAQRSGTGNPDGTKLSEEV